MQFDRVEEQDGQQCAEPSIRDPEWNCQPARSGF
jgi:hypothetical protein